MCTPACARQRSHYAHTRGPSARRADIVWPRQGEQSVLFAEQPGTCAGILEIVTAAPELTVQDALWLTMDRPNNLMVIDSLLWFDEEVPVEDVREVIDERLVARFPVFSCCAVPDGSGWRWEPCEDFDLADHVVGVDLPEPAGPAELRAWIGEQRSTPLDRDLPLWVAYVVQNLRTADGDAGGAILLRTHHALADGVRLTQVLLSLCDIDSAPVAVGRSLPSSPGVLGTAAAVGRAVGSGVKDAAGATARTSASAVSKVATAAASAPEWFLGSGPITAIPSSVGSLVQRSVRLLTRPERMLDVADAISTEENALVNDVASTAKLLITPPTVGTVWSGVPGEQKASAFTSGLSLADAKAIGKATGTTINEVLLGAVSGALTRYLRDHGDDEIDEVIWMVPVSVRPFDPTTASSLGNHFSLVELRMPIGVDDVAERLQEMHHRMERIKNSHEPLLTYGVQLLIASSPKPVAFGLTNFFANKAVGVLTNVPGPREPVYLAGHEVAGILGWAPCSGDQVMTVCIFSYNGKVSVGFGTDATLIPDSDVLGDLLAEEFEHMRTAVLGS